MSQSGKIQAITGLATARTPEGQIRDLQFGDFVYENEIVETLLGASVSIIQEDGNVIALNGNDQIFLDESVNSNIDPTDAVVLEVAALQEAVIQALENNIDIGDLLEETAAGGVIDFYDYKTSYHAGDSTKGNVGSYLLDSDNERTIQGYEPFIGDSSDQEINVPIIQTDELREDDGGAKPEKTAAPVEDTGGPSLENTTLVSITGDTDITEGQTAHYVVSVDGTPGSDVTVNFTYTGVAIDGTDFTGVSSVVIIGGTTSEPIDITTIDDPYLEGAEDFNISIISVSGGGFPSIEVNPAASSVVTTILDGSTNEGGSDPIDTGTVTLSGDATVVEGELAGYLVSVDKTPTAPKLSV